MNGLLPGWVVPIVAQFFLFSLITGMAASVDTATLRERFRRCGGVGLGLCFQFILLPLVGFLTVTALRLPEVYGIALLAVTASPGGAYSNWWVSVFNGDLALSIAMTTCSTIASVAVTPINLAVYMRAAYGTAPRLDFGQLIGSIAVAVFAIITGLGISMYFPQRRGLFNKLGNVAGLCLIIFSCLVGSDSDEPLLDKPASLYVATIVPCLLGLVGSFLCCCSVPCLSKPEAIAVTVETCYQNTGLALTIALASFEGADRSRATWVPLFYGIVQIALIPVFLAACWKSGLTYAPKDESFWRVISQSWQPTVCPQVGVEDVDAEAGKEASEEAAGGTFANVVPNSDSDKEAEGRMDGEGGDLPAPAPAPGCVRGPDDAGGDVPGPPPPPPPPRKCAEGDDGDIAAPSLRLLTALHPVGFVASPQGLAPVVVQPVRARHHIPHE